MFVDVENNKCIKQAHLFHFPYLQMKLCFSSRNRFVYMKFKLEENIPNSLNFCCFVSCNFQQTSYALAQHCIANCFNNLERCSLSPTFPLWICVPQHVAVTSEASNQKAGKLCPDMGHRKSQQNASYTRRACCPYFRSHTHTQACGGSVRFGVTVAGVEINVYIMRTRLALLACSRAQCTPATPHDFYWRRCDATL